MESWKVGKIAEIVGGKIIAGDGEKEISLFLTDSRIRKEAGMFVPIIGEHADGHDYISGAYKSGMRATFTSRQNVLPDTEGMVYVLVDNTVEALQRFGAYLRSEVYPVPLIGITGSVGKTTTKEMIAAAVETGYCTLKTAGNMNSQIGVPQMMCRLDKKTEIAVIEMGMSMPGEMERLAGVAKPDIAVVTNIGVSHIGQLGSQENIRREKLCLVNASAPGTLLLVNGDDPLLAELAEDVEKIDLHETTRERIRQMKIMTFGLGEGCDFRAENIKPCGEGQSFQVCYQGEAGMECQELELSVAGEHNVRNALAAVAAAVKSGLTAKQAAQGLKEYHPIAMRGGKIEKNEMIFIDDTYNASPDSMKSGIDILMATKAKRHIAVLADMLELGAMSRQCHEQVGAYAAAKGVSLLIAIGKEAEYIACAARGVKTVHFTDNAQALPYLKENLAQGDAVLFKGSRGMHLEELIQAL